MTQLTKQNIFRGHQNSFYDNSASFRCNGRLFHILGPAAANAPLLKVLYVIVHVTTHVRLAVERSRRSRVSERVSSFLMAHQHNWAIQCHQASTTRWQSSAKYDSEMPDRWTSIATLKSTCWRTASQCRWQSTGILWSERRVPVTRRGVAVSNRLWWVLVSHYRM